MYTPPYFKKKYVDYHQLTAITVKNKFLISVIDDLLHELP